MINSKIERLHFNDKEKKYCNCFNSDHFVTVRVYYLYLSKRKGFILTTTGPMGLPMLTKVVGFIMMIAEKVVILTSGRMEKYCGIISRFKKENNLILVQWREICQMNGILPCII